MYEASAVNEAWHCFVEMFTLVLDLHIPQIKIKDPTAPGWVDAEVCHAQNKVESAWRRARNSDSPHQWAVFRKLRNGFQNLLFYKYRQ